MIVEQSRKDLLIISQGQGIGNFYGLRRKPITTVVAVQYPQINMKASALLQLASFYWKVKLKFIMFPCKKKSFQTLSVMKTSTYFD